MAERAEVPQCEQARRKLLRAGARSVMSSIVQRFQFAPLRWGISLLGMSVTDVMPPQTAARRARARGAPGALLRAREFSAGSGASSQALDIEAPVVVPGPQNLAPREPRRTWLLLRACINAWLHVRFAGGYLAANAAMPHLRYLRRPAALKIVSSETSVRPRSLSQPPTARQSITFETVAWSGTPLG